MATSTTTLLEAINTVLFNIGERSVSNLVSIPAQKAQTYVEQALQELADSGDWRFVQKVVNADSWSSGVATMPTDIVRLLGVSARLSLGGFHLTELDVESFQLETPKTGTPLYYYLSGEDSVTLQPYPADADTDMQGKIFFHYIEPLIPPTTVDGLFPVPERFMRFITTYASALMTQYHLHDVAEGQRLFQLAQQILRTLQLREPGRGVGQRTMWRGRRPH